MFFILQLTQLFFCAHSYPCRVPHRAYAGTPVYQRTFPGNMPDSRSMEANPAQYLPRPVRYGMFVTAIMIKFTRNRTVDPARIGCTWSNSRLQILTTQ